MLKAPRALFFAGLVALSAAALAGPSPVGKWVGTISFTMPKGLTPDQQKMVQQQLESAKKMRITLDLKKDGTYVGDTKGIPGQKDEHEVGKWKQNGDKVTFKSPKDPEQTVTLSKDGKTMTMALPQGQGALVFKKQ